MRLLLSVGLLVSANVANAGVPNFRRGDCVQRISDVERWEDPEPILKILEVGRGKYRTAEWLPEKKKFSEHWDSYTFLIIDAFNSKVKCPK